MECLKEVLTKSSEKYNAVKPKSENIDIPKDIIKIMTGDGAAIVFPFIEHYDILLFFAKQLLKEIHNSNEQTGCGAGRCIYYNKKERYCDIHPIFYIRVGIARNLGVIYKDLNENHNVAGKAINDASRVMDAADRDQILLNKDAYIEIVDNKPELKKEFRKLENVRIKRGSKDVFQYVGKQGPDKESYIKKGFPQKAKDYMSLTRTDLDAALKPIKAELEQFRVEMIQQIYSLKESFLNSQLLEGKASIYGAVIEAINKAEQNIRIVRLASRPAVSEDFLKALKERVEKNVRYDILVVRDPKDSSDEFKDNHRDLVRLLGDAKGYHARVLDTDNPICFDTLIVDNKAIGIGYTPSERERDIEQAILFENQKMAGNFVRWFRVIWDQAKPYDEWEDEQH